MSYKISIITPCYNITKATSNKEKLYLKSLESVQNQTIGYENIEHILIDDCSTDNTKEILEELAQEYPNMRILSTKENTGKPAMPRNIGIENARGKYVMFLDQDDEFKEDAFEVLYNEIERNDVDLVDSNYFVFDGKETFKNANKYNKKVLHQKDPNFITIMPFVWTAIFSRDFLIENNVRFPNSFDEDTYFMIDCILKTKKDIIMLHDYYSYVYTSDNKSSLTHVYSIKQLSDSITIHSDSLNKLIENKENPIFIKDFHEYSVTSLLCLLISRSSETIENKKKMISMTKDYMNTYDNIPIELPLFYKFVRLLVKYDQKALFLLLNKIIINIFDMEWFRKLFRNKKTE